MSRSIEFVIISPPFLTVFAKFRPKVITRPPPPADRRRETNELSVGKSVMHGPHVRPSHPPEGEAAPGPNSSDPPPRGGPHHQRPAPYSGSPIRCPPVASDRQRGPLDPGVASWKKAESSAGRRVAMKRLRIMARWCRRPRQVDRRAAQAESLTERLESPRSPTRSRRGTTVPRPASNIVPRTKASKAFSFRQRGRPWWQAPPTNAAIEPARRSRDREALVRQLVAAGIRHPAPARIRRRPAGRAERLLVDRVGRFGGRGPGRRPLSADCGAGLFGGRLRGPPPEVGIRRRARHRPRPGRLRPARRTWSGPGTALGRCGTHSPQQNGSASKRAGPGDTRIPLPVAQRALVHRRMPWRSRSDQVRSSNPTGKGR